MLLLIVHLCTAVMAPPHESQRSRKAEYARVRKRRINLMKKAEQFRKDYDAEVYVVVFKNSRFYTYSSTDNEQWPPTRSHIVCCPSHSPFLLRTDSLQLRTYPLPQLYTPQTFTKAAEESNGPAKEPREHHDS